MLTAQLSSVQYDRSTIDNVLKCSRVANYKPKCEIAAIAVDEYEAFHFIKSLDNCHDVAALLHQTWLS